MTGDENSLCKTVVKCKKKALFCPRHRQGVDEEHREGRRIRYCFLHPFQMFTRIVQEYAKSAVVSLEANVLKKQEEDRHPFVNTTVMHILCI